MRHVQSADLCLAAREYDAAPGHPDPPHLVLVHGYPDNQHMWEPVAVRLAAAGMHVVTYDVRGAGSSDVPRHTRDYRTDRLVDDLVAVVEATVPERSAVHLVGHDWGSVQLWEAVLAEGDDPRLRGRIASFTSASGPALEHVAHVVRHPEGRRARLLRQLRHSWYVYAFQVPVVPELLWRAASGPLLALARRIDHDADPDWWGPELADDAAHGVNLYRANVLTAVNRPARHTPVPTLVVLPLRDPFLTDVTLDDLEERCSDLRVVRPDAGHWLPRSHPDVFADLVSEHVRSHA